VRCVQGDEGAEERRRGEMLEPRMKEHPLHGGWVGEARAGDSEGVTRTRARCSRDEGRLEERAEECG
jgi:hypothetical protein